MQAKGGISGISRIWIVLGFVLLLVSLYIGPDRAVAFRYDVLRVVSSISFMLAAIYFASRLGAYGYIVILPLFVILSLQVGYRFNFGERISRSVLAAIVETSAGEATGVLSELGYLFVVASASLLLLFVLFSRAVAIRKMCNGDKWLGSILAVTSAVLVVAPVAWEMFKSDRFISDVEAYPPVVGAIYYDNNNMVFGSVAFALTTVMLNDMYQRKFDKAENKNILGRIDGERNVVLVIGESSLATRYSAWGYHLPTSPGLDEIARGKSACLVKNVHSSAPITRDSVAMTLSFHTPEDASPLFNELSIFDMAKNNGYKTFWLSAQPLKGRYEARYGFLVKKADTVELTNWSDDQLLVILRRVFSKRRIANKKFIVVQMNGSHVSYKNKYDSVDASALPDAEDYDKSIHKTDRFMSEVVAMLDATGEDYSMLFVSDHGEIVNVGHGMTYGGVDQYLIPMLVKTRSDASSLCTFVESLRNDNGYVNALSNKFIVLKMLGYVVDDGYIKSEVDNDRVLHSNGEVYDWAEIVRGIP